MATHPVMDKPLIIEARLNEIATREAGNPNVPYSSQEIIEAGCRAWEAGASIIHWHGRDPVTGEPRNDIDLYLEVIAGLRARTDALVHPTLGYISQQGVEDRVKHIRAADRKPETLVDLVPVDFGSINVDLWNPESVTWESLDKVYMNPRSNLDSILRLFQDMKKNVLTVCWDTGHVRTARCFQEQGLLQKNTLWEFFFSGERMPTGAAVSLQGLQVMLSEIEADDEWLAAVFYGDCFPLAAWAIPLGGHVALGLGDYPYTRFGTPTNADLVRTMADLAKTLGRPVAKPADVRRMLNWQTV